MANSAHDRSVDCNCNIPRATFSSTENESKFSIETAWERMFERESFRHKWSWTKQWCWTNFIFTERTSSRRLPINSGSPHRWFCKNCFARQRGTLTRHICVCAMCIHYHSTSVYRLIFKSILILSNTFRLACTRFA